MVLVLVNIKKNLLAYWFIGNIYFLQFPITCIYFINTSLIGILVYLGIMETAIKGVVNIKHINPFFLVIRKNSNHLKMGVLRSSVLMAAKA